MQVAQTPPINVRHVQVRHNDVDRKALTEQTQRLFGTLARQDTSPSFSIHATVRRSCTALSLITITVGGMAVCIMGSPMHAAAFYNPLLYIGNTGENFTRGVQRASGGVPWQRL